ncbi:uncharacterized protein Tco025E_08961 [Trypanosoma conorhini]|uniref:Transmembrane protein n=1 Tax=Trypanosoma conorhini TaxID=83891 RepID=A0A3R7RCE5_9TRYP|nr:uncharacterized protein Tco025E_08961 [Trypanosoma conorhini]RNE99677.1 hypothetical protein Tco025E_08961 [Trypanosoma conorhini]
MQKVEVSCVVGEAVSCFPLSPTVASYFHGPRGAAGELAVALEAAAAVSLQGFVCFCSRMVEAAAARVFVLLLPGIACDRRCWWVPLGCFIFVLFCFIFIFTLRRTPVAEC